MGVLIAALVLTVHQALPPPGDGEIRAVYWELRNEAEVWLTIEPKSAGGKTAPQGMTLTLTRRFAGKWPDNQPRRFEIRANAGLLWNPKNELRVVIDGREKIDFVGQNPYGPITGEFSTYVAAELPVETLDRLARASRVTGNALGLEFELTPSQRQSVREFFDRAMSDNPARLPRNPCCHTEQRLVLPRTGHLFPGAEGCVDNKTAGFLNRRRAGSICVDGLVRPAYVVPSR